MEVKVYETQLVQVKLIPAQTAEERKRNIIANIVLEGNHTVPYIDDAIVSQTATHLQALGEGYGNDAQKKRLRYYSTGRSSYKVLCPLCKERSNAAVMRAAGCKDVTCCLSLLSCFIPIFWLCCISTWCGCNREWTTKGLYCSRCGGKLGIQQKTKD